jgi:hypothetical protein
MSKCKYRGFGGLVAGMLASGTFGGLVAGMLASGTQARGFKPGRSRRIFQAEKILLRRGSTAVCPMSQICGMLKNPTMTWKSPLLG